MSEELHHPFQPVYDKNSRILILGSFPSVKSRELGFYYGHPRNRFWPILTELFKTKAETIEEKKNLILSHHLALWDAASSCTISGSSDISIAAVIPNDIPAIMKTSGIERIIANGTKAYEIYMSFIYPKTGIEAVKLPSTSPANAAWSLDDLIKAWGEALSL